MSIESGAYRWWENYLVRYFMPSIAGAAIVNWLVSLGDTKIKSLLLLEVGSQGLQTPTLVLLFLYGNLFCYVSSYPILGFHVTRVVDFEDGEWRKSIFDGYISTLILALFVLIACVYVYGIGASRISCVLPFIIAILFAGIQLYRIYLAMKEVTFDGLKGSVSKIYAYTYALSRRRGIPEELRITSQVAAGQEDQVTGDKFDEETEWQKKTVWRREFIDSYRHMREHGNSAFIFILELTLAGLCFLLLVVFKTKDAQYQLSAIGVLLAIWAIPAIFVHFIGQHIERRFSWYDRKVNTIDLVS